VTGYTLSVDLEAVDQLMGASDGQRQDLVNVLTSLRQEPFLHGDFRDPDATRVASMK
jgi:hypothetical protein